MGLNWMSVNYDVSHRHPVLRKKFMLSLILYFIDYRVDYYTKKLLFNINLEVNLIVSYKPHKASTTNHKL